MRRINYVAENKFLLIVFETPQKKQFNMGF